MASPRTDHSQLPSPDEMAQIAGAETQRPLPPGKAGVHYVDFASIERLCELLGIVTDLFKIDNRTSAQILRPGAQLLDRLVGALQTDADRFRPALDDVYDYLCQQDQPQQSDLIFVFGGKAPARIEKAIALFNQGIAPKMVISGHGPLYDTNTNVSEAARYARLALQAGVPQDAIVVEDQSITMVDNIRRSLDLLEKQKITFNSIVIVNSPFAQRRGWCMWRKYVPDDCHIYRVNAATERYGAEQWFTTQDGLRTVLGEFIRLRNAITFDSV